MFGVYLEIYLYRLTITTATKMVNTGDFKNFFFEFLEYYFRW